MNIYRIYIYIYIYKINAHRKIFEIIKEYIKKKV